MIELLSTQQMRDLEQAAMTQGPLSGLELMERAGRGVLEALLRRPLPNNRRALVLCGPGNNGGDGFVIARLLAEQGWQVALHFYGEVAKLPPDARINHDRWAADHAVQTWSRDALMGHDTPDVVIDAVFGMGLRRPLPERVTQVFQAMADWPQNDQLLRVAVDCPSGLDLDSGLMLVGVGSYQQANPLIRADLTVSFHAPKPGHYLGQGPDCCGALEIVDIGLHPTAEARAFAGIAPVDERIRLTPAKPANMWHPVKGQMVSWPQGFLPKLQGGAHKYDFGHVVVFSGGVGRGGAARLAARAALRIGAGLVTLICPKAALIENAMQLNAVMLRGLDDPAGLDDVADHRVSGFCIGPGLGVGARTRELVENILLRGNGERPAVVLDADALSSFAERPEVLFDMLHERSILTPHEGEFARLFPDLAVTTRGARSKIDVVRAAARRAGCTVLLKGPDTVIGAPDGRVLVHAAAYGRAVPWLATAGAGDVLAGLIAGLAAAGNGDDMLQMAEIAAWLHVEAARSFGPGLIAEDLPEQIPNVLRYLDVGSVT